MTGLFVPGLVMSVFLLIHTVLLGLNNSGIVSFTTILSILAMWLLVSLPLSLIGALFGFRKRVSTCLFLIHFKLSKFIKKGVKMFDLEESYLGYLHHRICIDGYFFDSFLVISLFCPNFIYLYISVKFICYTHKSNYLVHLVYKKFSSLLVLHRLHTTFLTNQINDCFDSCLPKAN